MQLKYLLPVFFILFVLQNTTAQKFITKTGIIEISSHLPVFTIKGVNNKVASILDTENGEIFASTLIRSFMFEEALVEENFNNNYLEPEKFPQSHFQGKITNYKKIDFSKDGNYNILIEGKLTIHGVTNYIKEKGTLSIKDGTIITNTAFQVSLTAFGIEIGDAYSQAIKDEVLLKIQFSYKAYSP